MTELQGAVRAYIDTGFFRVTVGRYAPKMRICRHDHEYSNICLALSGGYDERLDYKSRRVEIGTLVIHPEGEAHANDHAPVVTDLLTVEFSPAAAGLVRQASKAFMESCHRPALSLLPAAYRIMKEVEQKQFGSTLMLDDLVWSMIAEIAQPETKFGRPAWLSLVRDYLESHFAEAPPLVSLAEMAGVHPAHLTRAFRKAFGCSIGAFVQRRQAAVALSLLLKPGLGLAEISAAAGYADQSHMTRRLSALTGRPPGKWRRNANYR